MTEDEEEANSEQKRNLVAYRQKDHTIVNNKRSITNRFLGSLVLVSLLIVCIYIPPLVYRNFNLIGYILRSINF
jgi:hypothetical protein